MKIRVDAYTFDASAQTLEFTGYGSIALEAVMMVVNTTDQVIIYNPFDSAKGGTVATNVLTMEFDTTSMDDADDLLILYEDTAQDFTNDATHGTLVNLGANNDVTVTGTVAVTQSGTWDEIGINDSGNSITVDNNGTFAVQVDGAALTALQLIDDAIKTDDSGFTVATDEVMMAGHVAVAHGSNPDAADAADAVARLTNRHRIPFIIGGHPNILTLKHANITTAVTDTAIITAGSGVKIVVTRLTVTLDNASTVYPTVLIGFGPTNTPTTTGVLASHGGVPAGGGFTIGDGSGMLGVGADGDDLRITTTGNATGNGLQVTVSYYTIES